MLHSARVLPVVMLIVTLVVSILLSAPARSATHLALPARVRVNIAGLGVTRAAVSSTVGNLTVALPDGRVLYRGAGITVARRDVRRSLLRGGEIPAGPEGIEVLRDALQDSRLSEMLTGGTVPVLTRNAFEIGTLEEDGSVGPPLHADPATFTRVRYTTDAGLLSFNGRSFRGTLEIATDDEGDMIVVNEVGTGDYLRSVVGSEIPNSWEPAALAAQAVAARTYLATRLARHAMYDLEGDTRDQAYDGVRAESAASIRAVTLTAGLVATYRGQPIEAYYSANAGGITENGENIFPGAGPYLRSVPSPTDVISLTSDWGRAGYVWTRDVSAKELRDLMAARRVDLGMPERIEIVQASPTGRVLQARIVGRTGTETVTGERTRAFFGILSTLYTVTKRTVSTVEEVAASDLARIGALERLGADLLTTSYRRTVTADRDLVDLAIVSYRYKHPDRFTFSGRGFGHGVGMSQWGMQGLAVQGATFEQILRHYYTGIELTNVGGG